MLRARQVAEGADQGTVTALIASATSRERDTCEALEAVQLLGNRDFRPRQDDAGLRLLDDEW